MNNKVFVSFARGNSKQSFIPTSKIKGIEESSKPDSIPILEFLYTISLIY